MLTFLIQEQAFQACAVPGCATVARCCAGGDKRAFFPFCMPPWRDAIKKFQRFLFKRFCLILGS